MLGPKWIGVIGPLRLLGVFVAFRSLTTLLPKILTAVFEATFAMWSTLLAALILPISFLVGSHWGTVGIAAAWIIMYPPLTIPLYYKTFTKIEMKTRDYVSSIMPAVVSSLIMAFMVTLVRWKLPIAWHTTARLVILVLTGACTYFLALVLLYAQTVKRLIRVDRTNKNTEKTKQLNVANPLWSELNRDEIVRH